MTTEAIRIPTGEAQAVARRADTPKTPHEGAAPRLDHVEGLRGIAVLGVLVAHASIWSGFSASAWGTPEAILLDLGTAGVDLFFVISGFCMLWPRLSDDGVRPLAARRFYVGRAKRIIPPYLVVLLLAVAASWVMWRFGAASYWGGSPGSMQSVFPAPPADIAANVLTHATFTHGFVPAYGRTIDGAFWSLSTEWQFYLLLPVMVWTAKRWGLRPVLSVAIMVPLCYGFSLFLRGVPWTEHSATDPIVYRLLEFGVGMGVAVLVRSGRRIRGTGVVGLLAALGAIAIQASGGAVFQTPLWALAFGALVFLGARRGVAQRAATFRPIRWLGRISYSVYLLHGTVFLLVAVLTTQVAMPLALRLVVFELVAIPVVLVLARVLHALVEVPCVRWSQGRQWRGDGPTRRPSGLFADAAASSR